MFWGKKIATHFLVTVSKMIKNVHVDAGLLLKQLEMHMKENKK